MSSSDSSDLVIPWFFTSANSLLYSSSRPRSCWFSTSKSWTRWAFFCSAWAWSSTGTGSTDRQTQCTQLGPHIQCTDLQVLNTVSFLLQCLGMVQYWHWVYRHLAVYITTPLPMKKVSLYVNSLFVPNTSRHSQQHWATIIIQYKHKKLEKTLLLWSIRLATKV